MCRVQILGGEAGGLGFTVWGSVGYRVLRGLGQPLVRDSRSPSVIIPEVSRTLNPPLGTIYPFCRIQGGSWEVLDKHEALKKF